MFHHNEAFWSRVKQTPWKEKAFVLIGIAWLLIVKEISEGDK